MKDMFKPVHFTGNLFRKYLKAISHPAKIRIQNAFGSGFFSKGILLRNENGVLFRLKANDWITRTILKEGSYEKDSLALAVKLTDKSGCFIDVGANFGLYTCILAAACPHLKVVAIEPNHVMIKPLLNNIALNNIEGNVQVISMALADKNQLVSMSRPPGNNDGANATVNDPQGSLLVPSFSLEFLLNEKGMHTVELIKIDIEGNEFSVFEHFPFERFTIKNIILEYNSLSRIGFEALLDFFAGKGFGAFTVNGDKIGNEHTIPENNIWFTKK